ncbi:MAG: hypothetical protein ACKV2U_15690 [Bryobacteraceae bacterium]
MSDDKKTTPPSAGDGGSPAGGCVVNCPCKPMSSIKIISVTFQSDHDMLKDYDTDWKDGGARFPKPEWTPAAQHPVSHTMDKAVKLELVLEVAPSDACPETGTLSGVGPGGMLFEKKGLSFSAGQIKVSVTSDKPLEKKIQELNFEVSWKTTGTTVPVSPAQTSNTMFVTMNTPTTPAARPGITLKRMRHSVKGTAGAGGLDPHKIVEHVMSKWSSFNLNQVYDNAWELADDARDPVSGDLIGADCQTIVRHTEKVIKMVGCPGKAEFIVVWAKVPTPTKGEENLAYEPNVRSPKQWHNSHRPPDPARVNWRATLEDHGGGTNKYEACLRFTYPDASVDVADKKYYAGGVGKKNDANEVIRVFKAMRWVDEGTGLLTGVIHTY